MTNEETIAARVDESKANVSIKRMMDTMRLIVVGDDTPAGGNNVVAGFFTDMRERERDFLVPKVIQEIPEGMGADILTWCSVLIDSISLEEPSLRFPSLSADAENVLAQYVRDRLFLRGEWRSRQEKFLLHYLIDGMAFVRIVAEGGKPMLEVLDPMDCYWDLRAEIPADYRYVAWNLRMPAKQAEEIIGRAGIEKLGKNIRSEDDIVKFIEYWDAETHAFVTCGRAEVILRRKNELGFLPFAAMSAPKIPGFVHPIPPILPAVGMQTLLNRQRKLLARLFIQRIPKLLVDPAQIDAQSLSEMYENWEDTTIVQTITGAPNPMAWSSMGQIESELMALGNMLDNMVVRAMRVNPFAAGMPPRTETATADAQIASMGQLHHEKMAKRYEVFLADAIQKALAIGYAADEEPLTVVVGGQSVEVAPREFLSAGLPVSVRVSPRRESAEMLQQAMVLLSQLSNPVVMQTRPELVMYGIELLKKAIGTNLPALSPDQIALAQAVRQSMAAAQQAAGAQETPQGATEEGTSAL